MQNNTQDRITRYKKTQTHFHDTAVRLIKLEYYIKQLVQILFIFIFQTVASNKHRMNLIDMRFSVRKKKLLSFKFYLFISCPLISETVIISYVEDNHQTLIQTRYTIMNLYLFIYKQEEEEEKKEQKSFIFYLILLSTSNMKSCFHYLYLLLTLIFYFQSTTV